MFRAHRPSHHASSRESLTGRRQGAKERAELVATLDRLAPVWRELWSVLNLLNRVLESCCARLASVLPLCA